MGGREGKGEDRPAPPDSSSRGLLRMIGWGFLECRWGGRGQPQEIAPTGGVGIWGEGVVVEAMDVGMAGGRLASRPYQMGRRWNRGAPSPQSSPRMGEEGDWIR